MERVDFSNTLFRCSSLGHIMTEPTGKNNMECYLDAKAKSEKLLAEYTEMTKVDKKGEPLKSATNKYEAYKKALDNTVELNKIKHEVELSEGCKTHLVDIYVHQRYGRQTDISNKYVEKGTMVEEDGITLFSRVKKMFFKKNEEHLSNDFIKGTPDIFTGANVHKADSIIDVKCSWDIYTFFRTQTKKINSLYYWQLQGYMALTGATKSTLAYTLVDTPEIFLQDEKRRLFYKMNAVTEENQEYKEACEELEKSMRYDDIPLRERLLEFTVDRNDEDIKKIEGKVLKCRQFLTELQNTLVPETELQVA